MGRADENENSDSTPAPLPAHLSHSRLYDEQRFVYPVLSRRSRGISIGLNLNPDRICNFDCVYCQVNREAPPTDRFVDLDRVVVELNRTIERVLDGRIYDKPPFLGIPPELRRLNDIAFSGDGEPTTYSNFDEVVEMVAVVRQRWGLEGVGLVLITNASQLHRPLVQKALEVIDGSGGEVWAKLDAGSEAYYRLINRCSMPFERILLNILEAARVRPLVIQTMLMSIDGTGPSQEEVESYCGRLLEIQAGGGQLSRVQLYTVARPPSERSVKALGVKELEAIAALVRSRTGLSIETFAGSPCSEDPASTRAQC